MFYYQFKFFSRSLNMSNYNKHSDRGYNKHSDRGYNKHNDRGYNKHNDRGYNKVFNNPAPP